MKNQKYVLFVIIICLRFGDCFAQHYFARNGSGELRLIDDYRYEASFYSMSGVDSGRETSFFDTGYYRVRHDTLSLSSATCSWADVFTAYDTSGLKRVDSAQYLIQLMGVNGLGKWHEYYKYIVRDVFRKDDTIVLFCPGYLYRNSILSVYDNHLQRRVIPDESLFFSYGVKKNYYIIIYPDNIRRIYLDEFPLLIRGRKLIPIDNDKNFRCFVYNGFFFPKMDQKERELWKIGVMSRGIKGQEYYR